MKKRTMIVIAAIVLTIGASASGAQSGVQPIGRPDLVVSGIDFQKVQSGTDSGGKTYWIFNVIARVKNLGRSSAAATKLRLERNNGAGGAFQTCPTCVIDIPVLAAGQEVAAAPRQFNNANGAPSKFRATADCTGLVAESNEGNNRLERTFIQMVIKETGPLPIHKD